MSLHPIRWLSITLLTALLSAPAWADRTAAPLPLFASPDLSGAPVLTLPAGKPIFDITRSPSPVSGTVSAVPYGEQVYYARSGLIKAEGGPGLTITGQSYTLTPQPAGRELTLNLSDYSASGRGNWEVRILPLGNWEKSQGLSRYQVTGPVRSRQIVEVEGGGKASPLKLPGLPAGFYLVTASQAGAPAGVQSAAVLQITNLNLLATVQPDAMQIYAMDALTGRPLKGVQINATAWTRPNAPEDWTWVKERDLPALTTDERGYASLPLRDGEMAKLEGRVQLGGKSHLASLDLTLWGEGPKMDRARAYIQTSKPVYRPGETVEGLAVVRRLSGGERQSYQGPVQVRMSHGWEGPPFYSAPAEADAQGLVRFAVPLAAEVKTGDYNLEVVVPSVPTAQNPQPDPAISTLPVRVQAYIKPQFTLDTAAPQDVLTGTPLPLKLQAELYAGGPAPVDAEVLVNDHGQNSYLGPDAPEQNPADQLSEQSVSSRIYGDSGYWDPNRKPALTSSFTGQQTVQLPLPQAQEFPKVIAVRVRARDEYGRDVLAERYVTVHPANVRFVMEDWAEQQGNQVTAAVQLRAVGTDEPLKGRQVTAKLIRTSYEADGPQTESVGEQTLTTDAQGWLRPRFDLPKEGSYTIRLIAQDAAGRTAKGDLWAGWRGQRVPVYHPEEGYYAELQVNQAPKQPGDELKGELRSNLPKGTPMLLEIGAEDRLIRRMITIAGPVTPLSVPVTAQLTPGLTLRATTAYEGQIVRAFTEMVPVVRSDRRLEVKVQGPQEPLKPGQQVTLNFRTSQGGRPVPALVTVGAVHEALYAVAEDPSPDPWRFFWGTAYPSAFQVNSYDSPPDGMGGGGGGPEGAPLRSDLRDVAVFGTVATGQDGQGQVTFTVPEALGGYRVSTRAFDAQTAAGEERSRLQVALPYSVRLSRPRVLTAGDQGSAYLSVTDTRAQSGSTQTSLQVGGQTLEQTLALKGGSGTVRFDLSAPAGTDSLTLIARAGDGTLGDAVQEVLPIRPAGSREVARLTGTGPHEEKVEVPSGQQPEALVLTLAASPEQAQLASLAAYLRDPAERWQTTDGVAASLAANLDLWTASQKLGWKDAAASTQVRTAAERDLMALMTMRLEGSEIGAGWGWTGDSERPTAEMTGRALSALLKAKDAGLLDQKSLNQMREEARNLLNTLKGPANPVLVAALAEAGEVTGHERLAAQLSPSEDALLAAALAEVRPQLAEQHYAEALAAARALANESRSGRLQLETGEGTAQLARAALLLGHTAEAQALLSALQEDKTGQSWGGPLDTAAAVSALSEAVQRQGQQGDQAAVNVQLGETERKLTLNEPQRLVFGPAELRGTPILALTGLANFAWQRELLTRRPDAAPTGPNMVTVERSYSKTQVGRDEVVIVTLRLRSPAAMEHLRLTDPLPGGLEAVDDRPFAFPGWENTQGSSQTVWADRSIYDDRAAFYLEKIPAGETVIRYQLRALAAGTYQAPAPFVDASSGGQLGKGRAERLTVR